MAVAASIDIVLGAQTAKLDNGLARGRKSLDSFLRSMNITGVARFDAALGGLAAKAVGIGAGLFAVERVIGKLSDTFNELEAAARISDSLEISIGSLQSLEMQARDSSIEADVLHTALQKLARATDASLKGLSVEERYRSIADRISQMTSVTDKVTLATKIFGRSGADLLPILDQGARGFEEARAKAERFGLVLSELEKDKIQKLDDAIDESSSRIRGAWNRFVVNFAEPAAKTLDAASFSVEKFAKSTNRAGGTLSSMPLVGIALETVFSNIEEKSGGVSKNIDSASKATDKLAASMLDVDATLAETEARTAGFESMMRQQAADAEFVSQRIQRIFEETRTPIEKLQRELDEVFSLRSRGLLDADTAGRATRRIEAEMKKLKSIDVFGLNRLDDLIGKGSSIASKIGEKIGDVFSDVADFFEVKQMETIAAPAAIEMGSAELFSLMNQNARTAKSEEAALQEKTNVILQKAADALERIKKMLEKGETLLTLDL